ncbi:molybdenum cofactor biosynthesis protein MoaE, partial [Streptomyces lonegramiae]
VEERTAGLLPPDGEESIRELAKVGDLAVVVAVACPHRAEAFAACRKLIDDLKHEVPIWKHQRFSDGTEEWVGAC